MKSYNGFTPQQREHAANVQREAIKQGLMPKPSDCKCTICGQDRGIRHYHNEDYSEDKIISDAKVVCWRCHMMIHARFKHPLSFAKYMLDVVLYKKRFRPVFRGDAWGELEQHYID